MNQDYFAIPDSIIIDYNVKLLNKGETIKFHSDSIDLLGEIIVKTIYPEVIVSVEQGNEMKSNLSEGFWFILKGKGNLK